MADNRVTINVGANFTNAKKEFTRFKNEVKNAKVNFNNKNIDKTTSSMKNLNKETKSLAGNIVNAFGKFTQWFVIGTVIAGVTSQVKALGQEVFDLDKDLTLLAFTTEFSNSQFEEMFDLTEDLAKSLGSTTSEVREAAKVYTNMNETLENIVSNAEAATVLSNLGGSAISINQAVTSLQALQNQFKLTNSEAFNIVDTLTFVSANLRVDFAEGIKEISNGISISGALAREAGLDYQTFISILGKTVESTRRSGASISSGKTWEVIVLNIPYVVKAA